ncbi:hypothetical protein DAPPUDRAFT_241139 [Daphnia pulex]|uniref:Uncharacterized protein n=1 Tax=Daphnia pulex TaxID=6669 RepID=E9GDI1_DAPPU|nr:hypothetical protein DAPPUDRAFT_241139 [Daphnia pulex]|eukprot:EFX82083.1 hypothetical protein DAPPUDRAFT_241139 [Daphnia pulex]
MSSKGKIVKLLQPPVEERLTVVQMSVSEFRRFNTSTDKQYFLVNSHTTRKGTVLPMSELGSLRQRHPATDMALAPLTDVVPAQPRFVVSE